MNLDQMKIDEFTTLLGSEAPAPGGGAAAALIGSVGIALSEMVCSLTVNSKKYADVSEKAAEYKKRCRELSEKLLEGMDKDAEAYTKVSQAYKMPHETEEEKALRTQAIQDALLICSIPPMNVMKLALDALELTSELVGWTTKSASSDLGVAAASLESVIKSAWLNVLININAMKDNPFEKTYRIAGQEILERGKYVAEKIYKEIEENL